MPSAAGVTWGACSTRRSPSSTRPRSCRATRKFARPGVEALAILTGLRARAVRRAPDRGPGASVRTAPTTPTRSRALGRRLARRPAGTRRARVVESWLRREAAGDADTPALRASRSERRPVSGRPVGGRPLGRGSRADPGHRPGRADPHDRRPSRRRRLPVRAHARRPPVRLAEAPRRISASTGCRFPTPTRHATSPATSATRSPRSARPGRGPSSPMPRSPAVLSSRSAAARRGVNIHLAAADLFAATSADVVDVTQPEAARPAELTRRHARRLGTLRGSVTNSGAA